MNQGYLCHAEFGGLRRGHITKDSNFPLPDYQKPIVQRERAGPHVLPPTL